MSKIQSIAQLFILIVSAISFGTSVYCVSKDMLAEAIYLLIQSMFIFMVFKTKVTERILGGDAT